MGKKRISVSVLILLAWGGLVGWSQGASAAEDKVAFLTGKLGESDSFKVRLKAAVMLGRMDDPRAVPPLVKALGDDNYVVRGAAARALGNLGHPLAIEAVDSLWPLVDDDEAFVQKESRRALERLAGDQSIDRFLAALSSDRPSVRLTAVHILATQARPEARSGVVQALGDSDEEVRAEAVVAIKGMGAREMESLLLMALEQRHNYQIQLTAAELAGELKVVAAMGRLADLLVADDVVLDVKKEAAAALTSMRDQINVSSLISQLNTEDKVARARSIQLLGLQGSREAVDALMGLLKDTDRFVRRRAVYALGDAGDARSIPALEFLLQSEQDPRFRKQIESTLKKLKP